MTLMPAKRDGKKYVNPVPTKVGGLSLMFKIGPRFFLGAAARSPKHSLGLGGHLKSGHTWSLQNRP
jgi:hypothetical protein